ncbi:SHD1 domain-containing protein [Pontiellaceae bacterium B12219]|nr:SHD1 domain-containing protein [Pontiellaceae bacterium B12219]
MMKNKKTAGLIKGAPSGFVISLLVHAAAFTLAGLLVVFTVTQKEEKKFIPPKPVDRPKMKLKKPKVQVKKSSKPSTSNRIVTKVQKANMPDIQLPEMSGMGEGFSGDVGVGFDLSPNLSEVSVFGSSQSIGNDFTGEVYSLLRNRSGGSISMGEDEFREVLRKYVLSGWKDSVLARFYRSPQKLYTTHFMVPAIPTAMAPRAFGVPELQDYYIFAKYEGQLVYKSDIKFRFWGMGDSYLFINVDGKEVLANGWTGHDAYFDWWRSSAAGSGTYPLGKKYMSVGDWIELKAGEPVTMKVLYGEYLRGDFSAQILVEVDGVDYPKSRYGGPLLPTFKTEEFTWDQLTQISRYLPAGECSLTTGPVFNDFHTPSQESEPAEESVSFDDSGSPEEPAAAEEPEKMRLWTLKDGRTVEAEFMTVVAGNLILKTVAGKQLKLPLNNVSDADVDYSKLSMPPKLDLELSKSSSQCKWGDTYNGEPRTVRGNIYTYTAKIRQTSTQPYGFGLTAEMFVIGDEIGGNKNILLDYQKSDFRLDADNDFSFEFSGRPVELFDYTVNNERRGQRYSGFLIVITDTRGKIIAYQTPSENLYRNLSNLRKLRVGWYFDKDCKRCLPTPPEPIINVVESF